jgi:hypothetical protein
MTRSDPEPSYFPAYVLGLPSPVQRSQPALAKYDIYGPQSPYVRSVKPEPAYMVVSSAWLLAANPPAALTMPAIMGVATLVPPTVYQVPAPSSKLSHPCTGWRQPRRRGRDV